MVEVDAVLWRWRARRTTTTEGRLPPVGAVLAHLHEELLSRRNGQLPPNGRRRPGRSLRPHHPRHLHVDTLQQDPGGHFVGLLRTRIAKLGRLGRTGHRLGRAKRYSGQPEHCRYHHTCRDDVGPHHPPPFGDAVLKAASSVRAKPQHEPARLLGFDAPPVQRATCHPAHNLT